MKKKIATCEDIKNIVKILKKHKAKKPYYIKLNIINGDPFLLGLTDVYPTMSPFYRDNIGTEELREVK